MAINLNTTAKNTWCPGCGNFTILEALKRALSALIEKGTRKEDIVVFVGIGCHAKIVDYIGVNIFYGLHGRAIPAAIGAKLANPNLKVIICAGDGDSFDEGIAHLIYASKRNVDITVLLHDNRVFALTTGQFTATSPKDFKGKATPCGSPENPFNPMEVMINTGATFVARGYAAKLDHLTDLMIKAIEHKGFSFVEILQPCIAWLNTFPFYNERVYEIPAADLADKEKALAKIKEWDYIHDAKISLGQFYQKELPTFETENAKSCDDKIETISDILQAKV